jgi:hypothetical protein
MFEEGEKCPICKDGTIEIRHLSKASGCTCFLGHPPCGYCTETDYACPQCDFDEEQYYFACSNYRLNTDHLKWNPTEALIFQLVSGEGEFVRICERHELSLDHTQWDDAERILFRLAV